MVKILKNGHTVVTDGRVRGSLSYGGADSSEESCELKKHICDSVD